MSLLAYFGQASNPPSLCVCVPGGERGHFRDEEDSHGVGSWAPAHGEQQLWVCLQTFSLPFVLVWGSDESGRGLCSCTSCIVLLLHRPCVPWVPVVCTRVEWSRWRQGKPVDLFSAMIMQCCSLFCIPARVWQCWARAVQCWGSFSLLAEG